MKDILTSLFLEANIAREMLAKAPFSGFKVGAGVLLDNFKKVNGANIECDNSALNLCAERVTMARAFMEYPSALPLALYIVSDNPEAITPCGMCRQYLSQFPDMTVYCGTYHSIGSPTYTFKMSELLPYKFVRDRPRKS